MYRGPVCVAASSLYFKKGFLKNLKSFFSFLPFKIHTFINRSDRSQHNRSCKALRRVFHLLVQEKIIWLVSLIFELDLGPCSTHFSQYIKYLLLPIWSCATLDVLLSSSTILLLLPKINLNKQKFHVKVKTQRLDSCLAYTAHTANTKIMKRQTLIRTNLEESLLSGFHVNFTVGKKILIFSK